MQHIHNKSRGWFLSSLAIMVIASACNKPDTGFNNLEQVNLVANNTNYAAGRIDPAFINGWGFDFSPFGPAFISSNGNATSVVYGTAGDERRSPITIPGSGELGINGKPTGVAFNNTNSFFLSDFNPARFIYAGNDGLITAWDAGDAAEIIINNSTTAAYTGVAIAQNGGANFLYAANFKEGKVDVFDGSYNEVSMSFTDASLPSGYSPYNICNIDGFLYVLYAKNGTNGNAETGNGKGYVDVYNTDGSLSKRLISGGKLNAPWGIVRATEDFGDASLHQPNAILVGNNGDGHINAYSANGNLLGAVRMDGGPITIPGLRQISFAPDSVTAEHGKLFFAAGPNGGQDALFGYVHNVQP